MLQMNDYSDMVGKNWNTSTDEEEDDNNDDNNTKVKDNNVEQETMPERTREFDRHRIDTPVHIHSSNCSTPPD